jgi:hypothetical protein
MYKNVLTRKAYKQQNFQISKNQCNLNKVGQPYSQPASHIPFTNQPANLTVTQPASQPFRCLTIVIRLSINEQTCSHVGFYTREGVYLYIYIYIHAAAAGAATSATAAAAAAIAASTHTNKPAPSTRQVLLCLRCLGKQTPLFNDYIYIYVYIYIRKINNKTTFCSVSEHVK